LSFLLLLRFHQALVLFRSHYVAGLYWERRRRVLVLLLIHLTSFSDLAQIC
jgi:hypothetical protein